MAKKIKSNGQIRRGFAKLYGMMVQKGFIVFGGGMNKKFWMNDAKSRGYVVMDHGDYATLWM